MYAGLDEIGGYAGDKHHQKHDPDKAEHGLSPVGRSHLEGEEQNCNRERSGVPKVPCPRPETGTSE